jgi:hypothetical protein
MLLVMHKKPVIKVVCAGIYDRVLRVSDARVSNYLMKQTVLNTVLPQHLSEAFFVPKFDVAESIHVHGLSFQNSSRIRTKVFKIVKISVAHTIKSDEVM